MPADGYSGTGEAFRIAPRRAPVTPRARLLPNEALLPIERHVELLLTKNVRGSVCLLGPSGAGKTVALEHLAATLTPSAPVVLMENSTALTRPRVEDPLVVFTSESTNNR